MSEEKTSTETDTPKIESLIDLVSEADDGVILTNKF